MKPACVSMFSGGGLADVGLMAAGYTPVGACEHDPRIAAVYAANIGPHIEVGDVRQVDPSRWAGADLLWASPPCQAHSVARAKSLPDREDADVGLDVLRWVKGIRPRVVVVENVPGYTKHPVFCAIVAGLSAMGYGVRWDIVDAADFGVPQNRTRLILRAERDAILLPMLPAPVPWQGWYSAVEDLVPTFPRSKFAPWQLRRLPEMTFSGEALFSEDSDGGGGFQQRPPGDPSFTVPASISGKTFRALLCDSLPPPAVHGSDQRRDGDLHPIQAAAKPFAFLVNSDNTSDVQAAPGVGVDMAHEPSHCVSTNLNAKAFLVNGANASRELTIRDAECPAFSVTTNAGTKEPCRAWLDSGRVVALTPRAIARLQTVPDWYELPDTKTLAGTVLGNGVPSLLSQRIAECHKEATR